MSESIQQMAAELRVVWKLLLAVAVAFGSGVAVSEVPSGASAAVPTSAQSLDSLRERVDTLQARQSRVLEEQERFRAQMDRVSRGVQFQICESQAEKTRRDLDCGRFWSQDDFLPPPVRP